MLFKPSYKGQKEKRIIPCAFDYPAAIKTIKKFSILYNKIVIHDSKSLERGTLVKSVLDFWNYF